MARPLKLYNYARAPNPRRVRIFAGGDRLSRWKLISAERALGPAEELVRRGAGTRTR